MKRAAAAADHQRGLRRRIRERENPKRSLVSNSGVALAFTMYENSYGNTE
jgi:hypothetical protein